MQCRHKLGRERDGSKKIEKQQENKKIGRKYRNKNKIERK